MIVHVIEIKKLIHLVFRIELVSYFEGTHIGHVEIRTVLALIIVKTLETVALVDRKVLALGNRFDFPC